jgi:hypothetical protein
MCAEQDDTENWKLDKVDLVANDSIAPHVDSPLIVASNSAKLAKHNHKIQCQVINQPLVWGP